VIGGFVAAVCLVVSSAAAGSLTPANSNLAEAARLRDVYDLILDARFDQAAAQLSKTCPPAPAGACAALGAVSLQWQILIEPESRQIDQRLKAAAAEAIAVNSAWTDREPRSAEAWFYLAGSYAPLAQLRVLRTERLAAARDGNTIRTALERALQLDPMLYDAYFGIGLYHYYAAVAPMYARVLRWLLLLPGGDRARGLQEMLRARAHGELLAGEADFQLQQVYLWYERRTREALALLESLDARYPHNSIFLERTAEVYDVYVHDARASTNAWETLRDRARNARVASARLVEARADRKLRELGARRAKN